MKIRMVHIVWFAVAWVLLLTGTLFSKGYPFLYCLQNLKAFLAGEGYDATLLFISLLSFLSLIQIPLFHCLTAAPTDRVRSGKITLHFSRGLTIRSDNHQKIAQLSALLEEEPTAVSDNELPESQNQGFADAGLDMKTAKKPARQPAKKAAKEEGTATVDSQEELKAKMAARLKGKATPKAES